MTFGGETWYVIGFYNEHAREIWRRKHRKDPRVGPSPGGVAIEVRGPKSVVDLDRAVLEQRVDIGEVRTGRIG